MNAERLHLLAKELLKVVDQSKLVSEFSNLENSLQAVVNSPADQNLSNNLAQAKKNFLSAASNSALSSFPVSWQNDLIEINAGLFAGTELRDNVREILERNQITPSTALEAIKEIKSEFDGDIESFKRISNDLDRFNLSEDNLSPEEAEISVYIPREEVNNDLYHLAKEAKEIDFIIRAFSEIVSGDTKSPQIRFISSSDFSFFVEHAPAVAACISLAIERIVAVYKNILEIKKLRNELSAKEVPDTSLAAIEDHVNEQMTKKIEELVEDIFSRYKESENERDKELRIHLQIALEKIADRIDRSFHFDVRTGPNEEPSDEATNDEKKHIEAENEHKRIIRENANTLRSFRNNGKPILKLPGASKPAPEMNSEKSRRKK